MDKRPLLLSLSLLTLLSLVGWGVVALRVEIIHSVKPNNYPALQQVFDSPRCGEVEFGRIYKGVSLITYDCYTTSDDINRVIFFYLSEGYRLEGRLLRHRAEQKPLRTNLTHMVNLYRHDDAPMQVRVTSIYTVQLPRFRDPVAKPVMRSVIPTAR